MHRATRAVRRYYARMTPALVDTRKTRLYAALAARDMTVDQLAALMRVDRARVHRWHSPRPVAPRPTKGARRGGPPSACSSEAIATALAIPPAALEVGGPWGPLVGVDPHAEVARRIAAETPEQAAERVAAGLAWLGGLGKEEPTP